GESVGDLLDADKEMALLLQELDTKYASSNVEITNISQKNIIENLIVPICNEITPRLQQLNKYFGSHTMHVTVKHGQTGLITESMLSELKNLIFQKIGDKKVYEIMFYYRGSTYIHNPHNKFHVSLTFLFTDTDYSVIAFVPPKRKLTLFTGTYDVDVAPEDTKDLTKKVMENIINGFRHISKEKPSSDIAKS
ncbi:MAG: hypothetical protein REI95_13725, partial [Oxalicibacterium faecigallinarum]|uniref:hypothetical protein n=1 Tax=Oxalicibacterium faecigallinarum TaxID=573741 RepID=UPI002807EF17